MTVREDIITRWRRGRAPGLIEYAVCTKLRELASQVQSDHAIVELGVFKGRSTGWLLLGAQEGNGVHVTSVDPWTLHSPRSDYPLGKKYGHPGVYRAFVGYMSRINADESVLTPIMGYAADVASTWDGPPVGLLWHDAEHDANAVERDLRAWLPHLADNATVILHDAGRPDGEVVEGARRVFDNDDWNWDARELMLWDKRPTNRGALTVKRAEHNETGGSDGNDTVLSVPDDDPQSGDVDPGADVQEPDMYSDQRW